MSEEFIVRGFFITGTDTDVGKTIVSAALLMRASLLHENVRYHKPIQTGYPKDSDVKTIADLISCTNTSLSSGSTFSKPLSPHLAAFYDGETICFDTLLAQTKKACSETFALIEGAGGLLVPINRDYFMIDLIKALTLPCIVVGRSSLGTINHTLLSIEALRSRQIPIASVIMVGPKNSDNEVAIRTFGQVDVLAFPFIENLSPTSFHTVVLQHAFALDRLLNFSFSKDKKT